MADRHGSSAHSLIDELMRNPQRFALYEAAYLLVASGWPCQPPGGFGNPSREVVRFRSAESLMFPSAQIFAMDRGGEDEEPYVNIQTTLPGLYGTMSPLPTFYSSDLISPQPDGEEERHRKRDFLDIFNHRLFSLGYRAEQYRLLSRPTHDSGESPLRKGAFALMGLGLASAREGASDLQRLGMRATGLLASGVRSAAGLKKWLGLHFPGVPCAISEFSPHWVRIPAEDRCLLGEAHSTLTDGYGEASGGTTIGDWVEDRETNFRVQLGPLRWDDFQRFLPDQADFTLLNRLVVAWAPDGLTYDIEITLAGSECPHLGFRLDGEARLGITSGLFEKDGSYSDLGLVLRAGDAGDHEPEPVLTGEAA